MKLSRKIKIINKLRSSDYIGKKDLILTNSHVINEARQDMIKQRNENKKKIHDKEINKMLSKNNIRRREK